MRVFTTPENIGPEGPKREERFAKPVVLLRELRRWNNDKTPKRFLQVWISTIVVGCFPKMVSTQPWGFPTKNDHFWGCFFGVITTILGNLQLVSRRVPRLNELTGFRARISDCTPRFRPMHQKLFIAHWEVLARYWDWV